MTGPQPGHADGIGSEPRVRRVPAVAFVLFVVGFGAVLWFIHQLPISDKLDGPVQYGLWETLLAALAGIGAVSGLYCTVWLVTLIRASVRVPRRTVASWIACVAVMQVTVFTFLFLGASSAADSVDKTLAMQARPITVIVGLCQIPGLVMFLALHYIAADEANWQESGLSRLRTVRRLRTELRRVLAVFGAFLTLLVIATGMRRRALLAYNPDLPIPAEQVLIYGLLFAVVLGVFYAVAASGIDRRAERLLDEFAPLPDPGDPTFSDTLRRRTELASVIGSTESWASFETTVVIAAPLLTALIGISTGN